MASVFFISDLHLQPSRADLAAALYRFIDQQLNPRDTLYILGDFFDAWIGDDEDGDFYLEIKQQLAATVKKGIAIYFMHGNRDFLIGQRFVDETGITLLQEPHVTMLWRDNVVLLHGDSLCTDDVAYMQFRAQVRNPQWQQQVLGLPLQQRRQMAAELRSKSKSMTSNKAADIMDVNDGEVRNLIEQSSANKIIHGHTHRPDRHHIEHSGQTVERIVLGDWDQFGWYLKVLDGRYDLVKFAI